MNELKTLIKSYISPRINIPSDGLEYWQEKLILYLTLIIFLFAFIAYIPSVYLSIYVDLWSIAIVDTIVYLLVIVIFLKKDLHYRKKLFIILGLIYALGVILIMILGVYGAGYLWLFVIPIIAGALLNKNAARLMLIANIITMIGIGLLQFYGISFLVELESFSLESWLIITANFIFLNIVATVTVFFIISGIQETIESEKKVSHQLAIKNKEIIRAKEDAEAADKLKTEFLAQISHEIRTPLNTIMNFSSIIAENSDDENREYCVNIENSARRIIRTVEQLLNMSDVMTGKYKATFRKIDLVKNGLDLLLPEYKKIAERNGLTFRFINEAVNTSIFADDHAVGQVLHNLLDNAIKFTEKGSVEVLLKNLENKLQLVIQDTGTGISEEYLEKIFYPFTQETSGYTREYEGLGLGLSLVQNYCGLSNIKLDIKSEKGKGTSIFLLFQNFDA